MLDLPVRTANQLDPLARQPEAGVGEGALSPMDPPDAYAPPGLDRVALTDMHPFLRQLCEEHAALSEELKMVEGAVLAFGQAGFTEQVESKLLAFCQALAGDFIPHSRHEEMWLFPLLHERLIADGEHSKGMVLTTAVNVMQDDHIRVIQLAAVIVNFLRLGSRLPDELSARVLRDAAVRHAKSLIELLHLHMFREDHIVFSAAQRLISAAELDQLQAGRTPSRRTRE